MMQLGEMSTWIFDGRYYDENSTKIALKHDQPSDEIDFDFYLDVTH